MSPKKVVTPRPNRTAKASATRESLTSLRIGAPIVQYRVQCIICIKWRNNLQHDTEIESLLIQHIYWLLTVQYVIQGATLLFILLLIHTAVRISTHTATHTATNTATNTAIHSASHIENSIIVI